MSFKVDIPKLNQLDTVVTLKTTAAVTISVSTSGLDSDPNRPAVITGGDYSAYPFLTIQAAINALPKKILHDVLVNIAAGSYAGFDVVGFSAAINSSLGANFTVRGTMGASPPTTGPTSGTATGGGGKTLVDSAATWTVNDLEGRFVNVTAGPGAGQRLVIASNTATTITFVQSPSPAFGAGSVYEIQEPTTIITSGSASSMACLVAELDGQISIERIKSTASVPFGIFAFGVNHIIKVKECVVKNASTAGIVGQDCFQAQFMQVAAFGAFFNVGGINVMFFRSCTGWFSKSGGQAVLLQSALGSDITGVFVKTSSVQAIRAIDCLAVTLRELVIDGAATGLYSENSQRISLVPAGGHSISNCTVEPMNLSNGLVQVLNSGGALAGSGNTGYGIRSQNPGTIVELTGGVPTLTGASGDASIDGTTPLTWAGDFAAAPSSAVNTHTASRIVRTS